jgi:Cytochrome oxidase complex assembly protein 1
MTTLQTAPPPRSGRGCLFGCLGALALLLLPIPLVSAYSTWFFYQGFRHDPILQAVSELVRRDGMAERVLGEDIQVTGIAGNSFSFMPGWGSLRGESRSDYIVALSGSRASGTLAVEAEMDHGHLHVDSMILTGPDGDRYDLMQHTIAPSNNPTTSI